MIILRNVPFERRARFLHDNVCRYPDSPEFGQTVSEHKVDIAGGLQAHLDLLRRVYSDVDWVEGKGDREKYLELVNVVAFLYAVFALGTLADSSDPATVLIDKDVLKKGYKKGALAKRKRHLERYGFSIAFLSAQGQPASLSKASQLALSYGSHPTLVPAVKYFAERIESTPRSAQKVAYNALGTFLKGDCEAGILQRPVLRDPLDPLRDDILDTVDEYRREWVDLVGALRDKCGLGCSGFWHYGASPSWGVSFSAKRQKPLAIFTLGSGIIFVEFTLPADAAERIIRERRSYSDAIRERIESFHCVQCPKDCKGGNLTKVDGVWLCSGRAEARRIYATLSSSADFGSIHSMMDTIY